MINQLFSYLLETSICLAIFYLFFRIVLWKEVFFVWNRMYILGTLVLSLIIPVIEIPLQTTQGIALQQVFVIQLQGAAVVSASGIHSFTWQEWTLFIYLSISLLLLGKLAFQVIKLWYYSRKFRSSQATSYRLILTEGKLPTFSFFRLFFWNNSQELSEADKMQILTHELTHIRQWHSADIVFVEIIKSFFWFHPAMYLFKQSMQQVHEYLADEAVIQQYPAGNYIQLLVSQVLNTRSISISTPFHQPPIKNRILMLQKLKQATPAFWKFALSLPIIAALVVVYSCQKSDVEESQPKQRSAKTTKSAFSSWDKYLDKYRAKYPQITIESVSAGYDKDGSQMIVSLTIKNVPNATDKQKIEDDLKPILSKALADFQKDIKTDETFAVPSPEGLYDSFTGEIFQVAENQPSPVGGYEAFYKYIGENMQYPQQARLKGIEGKVFIKFVVYSDGSIGDVEALNNIGAGCDEEAVKVIANAPKWIPGKQDGKPVNVRMSVPIAFKLN